MDIGCFNKQNTMSYVNYSTNVGIEVSESVTGRNNELAAQLAEQQNVKELELMPVVCKFKGRPVTLRELVIFFPDLLEQAKSNVNLQRFYNLLYPTQILQKQMRLCLYEHRYMEMLNNLVRHNKNRQILVEAFEISPWVDNEVADVWKVTNTSMFSQTNVSGRFALVNTYIPQKNTAVDPPPQKNNKAMDDFCFDDLLMLHASFNNGQIHVENKSFERLPVNEYDYAFFENRQDSADIKTLPTTRLRLSTNEFIPRSQSIPRNREKFVGKDESGTGECFYRALISQLKTIDRNYYSPARLAAFSGVEAFPAWLRAAYEKQDGEIYPWGLILIMRDHTAYTFMKLLSEQKYSAAFFSNIQLSGEAFKTNNLWEKAFGLFLPAKLNLNNESFHAFMKILANPLVWKFDNFKTEINKFWRENSEVDDYKKLISLHDKNFSKENILRMLVNEVDNAIFINDIRNWFKKYFEAYPINDEFLTTALLLLNTYKGLVINSLMEIIGSRSYLGTYHVFAVAHAFDVNVIIFQQAFGDVFEQDNEQCALEFYLCDNKECMGNAFIKLTGQLGQGQTQMQTHYLSVFFTNRVDEEYKEEFIKKETRDAAWSNKPFHELSDNEFLVIFRHLALMNKAQMNKVELFLINHVIPSLQKETIADAHKSKTQLSVMSAGYSYFLTPETMSLFFNTFYSLLINVQTDESVNSYGYQLLDQIGYFVSFVHSLYINYQYRQEKEEVELDNQTGRIINESELTEAYNNDYYILNLPATLGFRDEFMLPTHIINMDNQKLMLIKKGTFMTDARFKYIQDLMATVAMQTLNAMYDATMLVAYHMMVPVLLDERDFVIHDKDKLRLTTIIDEISITLTKRRFADIRKEEEEGKLFRSTLENFHSKTAVFAMRMFTNEQRAAVMNTVKLHLLHYPLEFHLTPFWDFYSSCLEIMVMSLFHSNNKAGIAARTVQSSRKLIDKPMPVKGKLAVAFTKQNVEPEKKTYDFAIDFDLVANLDKAFTDSTRFAKAGKRPVSFILAWFSSSNELTLSPSKTKSVAPLFIQSQPKALPYKYQPKKEETEELSDSDLFDRYISGTRISYSEIDIDQMGSKGMIVFMLDKAAIARHLKSRVFLHIAIVTRENDMMKRRGHAFINLRDILQTNTTFGVRLWEGPIKSSLLVDNSLKIIEAMTYKPVFDLDLTIVDPRGVVFDNEPQDKINKMQGKKQMFFEKAPNSLFNEQQMLAVTRYLSELNKSLGQKAIQMHSLLYVNFPLDKNVAPLWASLYMPPIFVELNVLLARLEHKLHDEGLQKQDFINICTVALRGWFNPVRELDTVLGESSTKYDSVKKYEAFAMQRFQWIVLQIINPYNKICYKFDKFEGASGEQMNYPWLGVGDCEDTAQAVNEFIRGIQLADQASGYTGGGDTCLFFVLYFLRFYTPCMCVMTTTSPEYNKTDMDKDINSVKESGLHMLCCLVPKHMLFKNAAYRNAKPVHPFLNRIVPVETTGFNYNSYVTPNMLLRNVDNTAPGKEMLLKSISKYNALANLAMRNKDARDETVNFSIMLNDERDKRFGKNWGSGETGISFVNPHYFYCRMMTMCHSLSGDEYMPKFLDFYYTGRDITKPSVNFKDAVLILDGTEANGVSFEFRPPLRNIDEALLKQVDAVCQEYADNVQPVPIKIDNPPVVINMDVPNEEIAIESLYHPYKQEAVIGDAVESMRVRSLTFYVTRVLDRDSLAIIKSFKSFLESNNKSLGFDVVLSSIELVRILNGAVEFYALHVYF